MVAILLKALFQKFADQVAFILAANKFTGKLFKTTPFWLKLTWFRTSAKMKRRLYTVGSRTLEIKKRT